MRHRVPARGLTAVPTEPRGTHSSELFSWVPPEAFGAPERAISDWFQTLMEDNRQRPAGNWLGIVLGIDRSIGELFESLVALGDLGPALSDLVDVLMSPEWLLLAPEDLAREVITLIIAPLEEVIEDIRLAGGAQWGNDQVEYSARVTQATIHLELIISGLAGAATTARRLPSTLRRLQDRLENLRSELRRRRVRQLRRSLSATEEDMATALSDHHYSGLPRPSHETARVALSRTRRQGLLRSNTALRDPDRRLGALLQTLIVGRGPGRQANFHELVGLAERAREARAHGQTLRVHRHPRGYRGPDGVVFEGSSSRSTPFAEATGRYEVTSVNEIRGRAVTNRSGRPRYVPNRLQALEWSIFDRLDSKIGPEGQIRSRHPEGLVRRGQVDLYVSSELGYTDAEIREAASRATRTFSRRPAGVRVRVRVVPDSSDAAIDEFLRTGVLPRPRTLHTWGRTRDEAN